MTPDEPSLALAETKTARPTRDESSPKDPSEERSIALADLASKVTIIIPAFNEEEGIREVLFKLQDTFGGRVADIIVVDDGSSDRTAELAEATGIRVIRHPINRGYGASLKTAIRMAESEYVLTMDADGQHRLADVAALIQEAESHPAFDLIVGHRTHLLHSPLWRMPGKWFLTRLAEYLVRRKIPDLNSGLRLMRRTVALKYVSICPQGFSFSTTITMAFLSRGYPVSFVPITVQQRVGKSTVSLKTGFDTILLVIRLAALFNPLRLFLPTSALGVLIGIGWGAPYVARGEGVTVASMLAVVTGILLFGLGLISDQLAQLRLERYE